MPQIDAITHHSPNHSARPSGAIVSCIVVHSCEGSPPGNEEQSSIPWLCDPASKVSSHFYITRAGIIYQLVATDREAWHAGDSTLDGVPNVNAFSVGIELEHHAGSPPYPKAQLDALTWLCADHLMVQYPAITPARVVSHRAVAVPAGRKSDPTDWDEAAFRAWADSLGASTLPAHGLILTHSSSLDQVEDVMSTGRFPVLKVVSAWGLPTGWTAESIARACALSCETILRTVEGDPRSGHPYPHAELIPAEIDPWYHNRRTRLLIELGNEPNADPSVDPAGYAWQLERCIAACRARYPKARIIAPALSLNDEAPAARWMQSPQFIAACLKCDLIGVHAYAHYDFDDTGQLARARRLLAPLAGMPWFLSEYGIHDPGTPETTKGQRYAALVKTLSAPYTGCTIYHMTTQPIDADQQAYAFGVAGATAYGNAL